MTFDGYCVDKGHDPRSLPLHRLCSFVYHLRTRNLNEKERAKFDMDLNRPPPGTNAKAAPNPRYDPRAEMAAFMGAMSSNGGKS